MYAKQALTRGFFWVEIGPCTGVAWWRSGCDIKKDPLGSGQGRDEKVDDLQDQSNKRGLRNHKVFQMEIDCIKWASKSSSRSIKKSNRSRSEMLTDVIGKFHCQLSATCDYLCVESAAFGRSCSHCTTPKVWLLLRSSWYWQSEVSALVSMALQSLRNWQEEQNPMFARFKGACNSNNSAISALQKMTKNEMHAGEILSTRADFWPFVLQNMVMIPFQELKDVGKRLSEINEGIGSAAGRR